MAKLLTASYIRAEDKYQLSFDRSILGWAERTVEGFYFWGNPECWMRLRDCSHRTMKALKEWLGQEMDQARIRTIREIEKKRLARERGEKVEPFCGAEILAEPNFWYKQMEMTE